MNIYAGTQPKFDPFNAEACTRIGFYSPAGMQKDATKFEQTYVDVENKIKMLNSSERLLTAQRCLPDLIELRAAPVPLDFPHDTTDGDAKPPGNHKGKPQSSNPQLTNHGPVLRTYSGLGIVKNAVERPEPRIEFVNLDTYRTITNQNAAAPRPWNAKLKEDISYYTLLPEDEDSVDCLHKREKTDQKYNEDKAGCDNPQTNQKDADRDAALTMWINEWFASCKKANPEQRPECNCYGGPCLYEADSDNSRFNKRLALLRRYLLIIVADGPAPPASAYVSYSDGKKWYYIDREDEVSEKNFDLLTLFLTMMATPSPATPPVQTINVGG